VGVPGGRGGIKGLKPSDCGGLSGAKQFATKLVIDNFRHEEMHALCKLRCEPSPAIVCVENSTPVRQQTQWAGIEKDESPHGKTFRA
jgi:hypothetical protein